MNVLNENMDFFLLKNSVKNTTIKTILWNVGRRKGKKNIPVETIFDRVQRHFFFKFWALSSLSKVIATKGVNLLSDNKSTIAGAILNKSDASSNFLNFFVLKTARI